MKSNHTFRLLPLLLPAMGLAVLILRLSLQIFCLDEKGLLPVGHPLEWLIWLLTATAVAIPFLAVRKLDGSRLYRRNFRASVAAAIGAIALAGGVFVSVVLNFSAESKLALLRNIFGLLAVPALIYTGLQRWKGRKPFFLGYGLIFLFFTLHTISHYPQWSSQPQMLRYIFTTFACIFLMLFSYYQTAFCVGLGNRRMQLGTGLLAAFFCAAAFMDSGDAMLYLTAGFWAITNLCELTPAVKTREEEAHDPS